MGLNSGEVVVRAIGNDLHMDYSAVGQTTHLAAHGATRDPWQHRLTAAALRPGGRPGPGHTLGQFPVKGLTEPVEVFELVGAVRSGAFAGQCSTGAHALRGTAAGTAGLTAGAGAGRAGHGQVVALVGEAGVGKSRTVYEFVHSHHSPGWSVLESASVSYGRATPYFPDH